MGIGNKMNRIPFGLVCNLLEIFVFRIGTIIANIIVIRIQIKNRLVARIIRKKSIVSKDERSMSRKIFPFINTRIFKTYRVCTSKIFDTAIKFSIILYDNFFSRSPRWRKNFQDRRQSGRVREFHPPASAN